MAVRSEGQITEVWDHPLLSVHLSSTLIHCHNRIRHNGLHQPHPHIHYHCVTERHTNVNFLPNT